MRLAINVAVLLGGGLRSAAVELRVGLLPTWRPEDSDAVEFVTRKAFADLRSQGLLANVTIQILRREGCLWGSAPAAVSRLYLQNHVSAILGCACTGGTEPAGLMAAHWDLPLVSNLARGVRISDKSRFETTARVAETTTFIGRSLREFLRHHNWTSIALVGDPAAAWMLYDSLRDAFKPGGEVGVIHEEHLGLSATLVDEVSNDTIDAALKRTAEKARIVVLGFDTHAIGVAVRAAKRVLGRAEELGLTSGEYVFVVPIGLAVTMTPPTLDSLPELFEDSAGQMRQTVVQMPEGRDRRTLRRFVETFRSWTAAPDARLYAPPGVPDPKDIFHRQDWMVMLAMLSYDAALVYGRAVDACLHAPDCSVTSGKDLMRHVRLMTFQGMSGRIVMNRDFEREVAYNVYALDPATGATTLYWEQRLELFVNGDNETEPRRAVVERRPGFPWNTTDGRAPPMKPVCGYRHDECPVDHTSLIATTVVAALLLSLFGFLGFYKWRQHQLENEILARSWEIPSHKLQLFSSDVGTSVRNLGSVLSTGTSKAGSVTNAGIGALEEGKVGFVGQARFDGRTVAVKQYPANETLVFRRRELLVELKKLKDVQHDNLTSFFGLSLDQKGRLVVAWEMCRKGSLADVVFNDEVALDSTFRGSIVRDVALGLDFLHHSSVGLHGQLSAENCVVDSRWTVKLTDFGLTEALRGQRLRGAVAFKEFSADKLLHTAPELLASWSAGLGLNVRPTKEGDVYAFAMVLYQVLTRDSLYDTDLLSAKQLKGDLVGGRMKGYRPPVPPKLQDDPTGEAKALLVPLMEECWAEDPSARPKTSRIRKVVGSLSSSKQNLVEHMMSVMEKYAANLERMVHSRTLQVQEERRRAEDLLARMLPASVAEELKAGRVVAPETFDGCTIYFSDIVGFTKISGRSNPLQVVQLLNYLYNTFDDVIRQFDAYKVETIGDAYMVASGIPKRNGDQHVVEIASMAVAIRATVSQMGVPHFPDEELQIRIGLHSGPCAAGVVGSTMPRYCLFGDTVNTASRMESTGEAMRIQISEGTKALLEGAAGGGAFRVSFRAALPVKGKGNLSTYWLEPKK